VADEPSSADLRTRIANNPLWYHCIDLGGEVVTKGWFDLRPIVDRLPWPDVAGKRCLDVATYDGFLAFELERRGAAEVVATDIPSHEDWDWLPRDRARGTAYLQAIAGEKGSSLRRKHWDRRFSASSSACTT
jgi:tRNA (mo5U34)-methyltransferase